MLAPPMAQLAARGLVKMQVGAARPDPLGTPSWLSWAAPAVGPVFLLVALRVWNVGVRHYRSTGSERT